MAQAPSPPRRVGEALSGATSLPRNLCARVVARVVAIARSPQSDPSPVLPRACPRVPTPATATRARRPADADPSPSPPHAGLTIEDTSGETSARLRARFAAAHGLDGVRFRPFGEALLDAEDRARDASRAAPPLARRDDAGWPDDAPAGDAAAGLLLGRLKSNKYSIPDDLGASDDDDDDANDDDDADLDLLDALPPGADPIDASPPRVTLRRARSMQTRDARRARARVACSSPARASTRWTTTRSCTRTARAWCGPPAASFARASPRPNPSDRHSGVVFPNETPPRIGTWTDRGSTGLDSCPTTRPTSPYCVSDTRRR